MQSNKMIKKIKYITHNFAQGIRFVNYMFYRFVSQVSSKNTDEDSRFGAMGLSNSLFILNTLSFFAIGDKFSIVDVNDFGPTLIIGIIPSMIMIHRLVYAKDKHIAIFAQFKKENKKSNKFFFYMYLLCSALIFWILKRL